MGQRQPPGAVRDAIIATLSSKPRREGTISEILDGVREHLGDFVASSSVRSYLRLNTDRFEHVARGRYRMKG